MPDQPSQSSPKLEYERQVGISRAAFRLLLLLTFVNTVLLAGNLFGPQSWPALRKVFADWKDARASAAAEAQRKKDHAAVLRVARGFTFPADYVAYTEVPEEALKLSSSARPYQPVEVQNHSAPPGWQAPLVATAPPELGTASHVFKQPGLLFLHERRASDGQAAYVLVSIEPRFTIDATSWVDGDREVRKTQYSVQKVRKLRAAAFVPGEEGRLRPSLTYELVLLLPDAGPAPMATVARRSESDPLLPVSPISYGNQLRFLGGSADAADGSHFTLHYELDGKPAVIDGWLRSDSILLRPREGQPRPSAAEPWWELVPSTRPAAP